MGKQTSLLDSKGEHNMAKVTVYGADWCEMTQEALGHLREIGAPFEYVNIDDDRQAAKWVAQQNGGKEKKPTIKIDADVLLTPSNEELDQALEAHGVI